MTGSRAERIGRVATVAACAAALLVGQGAALAQSRAPVSLIPPAVGGEERAPADTPAPAEEPGFVRAIPGADDSGVQIRDLGNVGADAVGLATGGASGLTTQMWRGTSRAVAEHLLDAMPGRFASHAAHDLARRLLLIAAEPPGSAPGDVGLVPRRVEKLIALGAAEDADRLLRAASAISVPQALIEPAILARLLTFDFDGACQAVATVQGALVSEFGQKALVFCQLLAQQFSEAVVGLELLREQNLAQDRVFFDLANTIISGASPRADQFVKPGQPSAINLALFRAAGGRVPAWFAEADAPSLLKAVAVTTEADRATRLAAVRRAARWGAVTPAELADIYAAMGIAADEVTAVLLDPEKASDGLRLAVIYLAADGQDIAVARAEVLREMWRLAARQGDWQLAARLTAPQLRSVQPTPAFSWFAGDAMAAGLAAGDAELALGWFDVAIGRGAVDEAAAGAVTALWPALRIATAGAAVAAAGGAPAAGVQARVFDQSGLRTVTAIPGVATPNAARDDRVPWDERRLADWIQLQAGGGPQGAAVVAVQLALFDALGESISDAFWLRAEGAQSAATALPPLDVWVGLQRAAQEGKVAETALYALRAVGEGEATQLQPVVLHSIVAALRRVGLTQEARALALEVTVSAAP